MRWVLTHTDGWTGNVTLMATAKIGEPYNDRGTTFWPVVIVDAITAQVVQGAEPCPRGLSFLSLSLGDAVERLERDGFQLVR